MGRVFNGLARVLLVPGIHDTQCGFGLFSAPAARDILRRSRLYAGEPRNVSGRG